jgi:hypothetical protein
MLIESLRFRYTIDDRLPLPGEQRLRDILAPLETDGQKNDVRLTTSASFCE